MQQTVRLLGDLGERYGSEHKYHGLRSPAEAIKLLCINEPKFAKELAEAHEHGIGYTVVQANEFLDYGDLHLPLGKNDLLLTPVVTGSGGGGGTNQVLLGIGLVALAVVAAPLGAGFLGLGAGAFTTTTGGFLATTVATSAATAAALSAASVAIGSIGASLVLSGVSQMLSPQPEVPTLGGSAGGNRTAPGENTNATGPQGVSRATSGEQSYAFSGPANTVGVGATVPLVYGKLLIGSHMISSKVEVTSESDPTGEYFLPPGPSSITINGEKPGFKFAAHNGLRTRRWKPHQVKLGDKLDGGDFVRKLANDNLYYNEDDVEEISPIKHYEGTRRQNLQILFEINKGLGRVIGNQTVPAFLTYEIVVKKDEYDGESPIFTNVRGTIQGLLKATETYRFCHAVTYGLSGVEDDDTEVRVKVRILDTDADNENGQLIVKSVGYKHFRDDDENEKEDLVSEG